MLTDGETKALWIVNPFTPTSEVTIAKWLVPKLDDIAGYQEEPFGI